jgi:amino-acid N-acetyltransferase
MTVRKASISDIQMIHELVNAYAAKGEMLGRSRSELYECLRDFFVAEQDGTIVGCCALHINWEDLAEVRSLAVNQDQQGKGIGKTLVKACLEEAGQLGINRVYALTYVPVFFERLGFRRVAKETLPQKVWGDCLKCPRFPNCEEEAVIREVD